ncbi:MAG: Asp-tRNA(Asn)/Glu-tRNA(Gln) amidotransferase GatCAB subunit C [Candidatus Doudnabacteria bacterium CG10_big_fil_rev_8_21_14_0_10_41_10]|uniref:Aspartyl/glutamyl-tRNA(Asn/Gln) amidotransferase subunit C n=1 Tax=Candidatus Doudnabacteria bacterium CG10_big_fil_rev_8_21_14_0_10_41_10 TaxID=1974551 RepID=A0A2H0VDM9_9BACT|nr:MAG: Asp-tRNA(Asn)/Glu-tRNA(Gln) amidotransferase GatCAB subunit C [Candidatus Doudnabacteria bacterium CG10_big_fil_rev_8_21_14_0_10_41_10]
MVISKQELEKIASLARIDLTDTEKEKLAGELSTILEYFEKLKAVDTSSVDLDLAENENENTVRKDVAYDSGIAEKILVNAPAREERFIKVKSVL